VSVSRPFPSAARPFGGLPSPVLIGIGAAWVAAIAAEATGSAAGLHHDSLLVGGPGFGPGLLLFLVAWQVMVGAMMVPLLSKGIVDSHGVMELVGFLEERYGITVGDEDLSPENFESVASIEAYVQRKNGQE
jgi:hypothetical protein